VTVQRLAVREFASWRAEGRTFVLVDVRTEQECAIARIDGARRLDADTAAWLDDAPRDTVLVFQCHHGVRSRAAAHRYAALGFTNVFNLEGGIDAWSCEVDPNVPQY
jgi:monothiol glutaredoxin